MSGLRLQARGVCVAVTLGLSGLLSAPAAADPTRARAHFDSAKRFFEVNEYRRAMDEFKVAYVEEPDPAFLYNIAECHRRLGEAPDALVFYRRFLLLAPAGAPARASVEKRIAELQARIRDAQGAAATAPLLAPGAPAGGTAASPSSALRTAPEPAPSSAPGPAATDLTAPAVGAPATATAESSASPSAAPASGTRPFYKRPWFFIVVGGALVAGTIGVWAASSGKQPSVPETPLGNQSAFR